MIWFPFTIKLKKWELTGKECTQPILYRVWISGMPNTTWNNPHYQVVGFEVDFDTVLPHLTSAGNKTYKQKVSWYQNTCDKNHTSHLELGIRKWERHKLSNLVPRVLPLPSLRKYPGCGWSCACEEQKHAVGRVGPWGWKRKNAGNEVENWVKRNKNKAVN